MVYISDTYILLVIFAVFFASRGIYFLKHKKLTPVMELFKVLFFIYILGLVYYTFLPVIFIPGRDIFNHRINIMPVKETILMFQRDYSFARYNVIGNILLLIPFGFFIPLMYKNTQRLWIVTLCGCLFSVTIESIQYLLFIRVTDIDDIILNTSGTVIGYILYKLFKWFIHFIKCDRFLYKIMDSSAKNIFWSLFSTTAITVIICWGIIFYAAYGETFPDNISDSEVITKCFNNESYNLLKTLKFENYKIVMALYKRNGNEYIEVKVLKKVFNNRYLIDFSQQLLFDKSNNTYDQIILCGRNNRENYFIYGKHSVASSVTISNENNSHTEVISNVPYFLISYPYDIHNKKAPKTTFFNQSGKDITYMFTPR